MTERNHPPELYTTVGHVVLIDESGNGWLSSEGLPLNTIRSLWVSAGVGIEWAKRPELDAGIQAILKNRFRGRCEELKASSIRRYLPEESTIDDVAKEVASLVSSTGTRIWVAATRAGSRPMLSHPAKDHPEAKDIARQLLLETISGYATPRYYGPATWLLVWDIGDAGALSDFSASLRTFRNRVSGYALPTALTPVMLGGLSHEWSGIQIADLYANLALHYYGRSLSLPDAKEERAASFETTLMPTLMRDSFGKVVGWKIWR